MEATVFNPIQQHLLRMFSYDSSEDRLMEMKEVLMHHFADKLKKNLNDLWDAGVLSQEKLDEWRKLDIRKL